MKYLVLAIGVSFLTAAAAQASPLPRQGKVAYSNLCWSWASGDAVGYRLVLDRSHAGDKLEFTFSEGPLVGPFDADQLVIDDKLGTISFVIRLAGTQEPARYRGRISAEGVHLTPTYTDEAEFVRRVRSRLKRMRTCHRFG